jgi:hypothetical protein
MCAHLHDTTSRYDTRRKVLTFLLVCPECRTEKVVQTLDYEPSFIPTPQPPHQVVAMPAANQAAATPAAPPALALAA